MNQPIKLYTIGFTQKTAQKFFETLLNAGVTRIIDTRLNNISQLAGFTKRNDLEYFLLKIFSIDLTLSIFDKTQNSAIKSVI
jgi:uncharacterized protein (DUF488 family)